MYSNATHIEVTCNVVQSIGSVVLEVSVLDFVKNENQMKIHIDRNWRICLLQFFDIIKFKIMDKSRGVVAMRSKPVFDPRCYHPEA